MKNLLDSTSPEEFWKLLLKEDPEYAYELLCAAPSLAKWKRTAGDRVYLDHAATMTRSMIVGVVCADDGQPMTVKEIEQDSKMRSYTIVNSPPDAK